MGIRIEGGNHWRIAGGKEECDCTAISIVVGVGSVELISP